jgi:hypothetical protein
MNEKPIKNLAASIRQKLTNYANENGRPFQEVFQYFAMERFLYRLSRSPHAEKFVLKGALMFTAWGAPSSRPTRDIDFLARMNNSVDLIVAVMQEICRQEVEPDGLVFDPNGLSGSVIKEDADYEGVRVVFQVKLENSRVPMQLDLGFGDVMTPGSMPIDYPTILDLSAPHLSGYSRETVIAEKFEAMVKLGLLNSRMKDFFDIWTLSRQFAFDGRLLASAISNTFGHRKTSITSQPTALTSAFATDPSKTMQWKGFLKKSNLRSVPTDLGQIVAELADFLGPPTRALETKDSFDRSWQPPGPWK